MRPWVMALLAALFIYLAVPAAAASPATLFAKYCGSCHNGVEADSFEEIVAKVRGWASSYPDIDSAFRAAYGMGYAELMAKMRAESGHVPEKSFQAIYRYFVEVFEEAARQAVIQPLPPTWGWEAETRSLAVHVSLAGLALAALVLAYAVREATSSSARRR